MLQHETDDPFAQARAAGPLDYEPLDVGRNEAYIRNHLGAGGLPFFAEQTVVARDVISAKASLIFRTGLGHADNNGLDAGDGVRGVRCFTSDPDEREQEQR